MLRKYSYLLLISILFASCDFLDFDESTGNSKDYAYGYFSKVASNATNVYTYLQSDFGVLEGALREAATDNAVYTWPSSRVYDVYNDSWSPINCVDNQWNHYYKGIRAANVFLENIDFEYLKRFEYDENYDDDLAKAKMYVNEVRFLRAYFYFELAKRYGAIPLVTKSLSLDEANALSKTSFDEIVNYIVIECDAVSALLPASHKDFYNETGRATKGAAMALKARALLYAASPLHNKSGDKAKWEKAAVASLDIIKMAQTDGTYVLDGAEKLFADGNNVLTKKGLILARRNGSSNDFEKKNLPIGFEGGNSGNTPTQNLVDAFEMADGTKFDWSNPAHATDPTANRDPRFYKTVAFDGSSLMGQTVETFVGGKNAQPLEGATMTGYYLKKYIDETISLDPANEKKRQHHFILFRYAEVVLNYAEALNEAKGADFSDATFTMSARDAINMVRDYAGMPDITADNSVEAFRARVRNERRVELAFEDHRFWDIRRWKIGEVVKDIYGVKIEKNGTKTYTKVLVQNRIWKDKMYLYPIPVNESYVNEKIGQNEGWE
jgi:hypothetical protein